MHVSPRIRKRLRVSLKEFLILVDQIFPGLLLAFGFGYIESQKKDSALVKKVIAAELKQKEAENATKILIDNSGKSDVDVITDELKGR